MQKGIPCHGRYALCCKMRDAVQFGSGDLLYIPGNMVDRGPDVPQYFENLEEHFANMDLDYAK